VNKAAFSKAYNIEDNAWNWLEHPDKRLQLVQFSAAMTSVDLASSNAILKGSIM
jgi:hypothetical protein